MSASEYQNTRNGSNLSADPREITRALGLILGANQVTELRALGASTRGHHKPQTVSGYFDNVQALVDAAKSELLLSAKGIYIIPNPVNPVLLVRAANRVQVAAHGSLTADRDVSARRWLLVDIDPVRPAGISSTDAEHEFALGRAREIRDALRHEGWPDPILGDSGNGAHLLYRIDLATKDDGLVRRCLQALALRFDDDSAKVDQSVFNPARIWKLYGTVSRKGDDSLERPHRMAKILEAPAS
jgi:hypothetical protein